MIQFRRGTSTLRLLSEEVLAEGQPFYETDTNKLYIGDNSTSLKDLKAINNNNNLENGEGEGSIKLVHVWNSSHTKEYINEATNTGSIALGKDTKSSGNTSFTFGQVNTNSGDGACVGGFGNTNSGAYASIFNFRNNNSYDYVTMISRFGVSRNSDEVVLGTYNSPNFTAFPISEDVDSTRYVTIGCGSSDDQRLNLLEITDLKVAIKNGVRLLCSTIGGQPRISNPTLINPIIDGPMTSNNLITAANYKATGTSEFKTIYASKVILSSSPTGTTDAIRKIDLDDAIDTLNLSLSSDIDSLQNDVYTLENFKVSKTTKSVSDAINLLNFYNLAPNLNNTIISSYIDSETGDTGYVLRPISKLADTIKDSFASDENWSKVYALKDLTIVW